MNYSLGFKPLAGGNSGPSGGSSGGATMDNLEKQLICPICLEMFSKPVVILPCQHNLCRKCASDMFQAANPLWQNRGSSSMVSTGGRFRCPSCRHEVVLDRHGVYGLQRNLLVENIIDIYKQQESSRSVDVKTEQQQQELMCAEHEGKINIYCLSCQTPTCSMCKVFGQHKDCDVAPLSSVHKRQKTELSDGIAILVATNDRIQALISQMEEICRTIEENGRQQKEHLANSFDGLVAILEERKKELVGLIAKQQDDKLNYVRSLIHHHGDHLETAVKLVETAIQSMEEPQMALFLQSAKVILEKIATTAKASKMERLEAVYESMNSFIVNTDDVAEMLRKIDFCSGQGDDEDEDIDEEELGHLGGTELEHCSRQRP